MNRRKPQRILFWALLVFCAQGFAMPFLDCCKVMNPESETGINAGHNHHSGMQMDMNMTLTEMESDQPMPASNDHYHSSRHASSLISSAQNIDNDCNLHCEFCAFTSLTLFELERLTLTSHSAQINSLPPQTPPAIFQDKLFRPPISA